MIFIDCSVPKPVAEAIKRVRGDVVWLGDCFPLSVKDEVWLAKAGDEGWLVITRDKHVRTRPGERQKIMDHGVGCFILNQKQDPTKCGASRRTSPPCRPATLTGAAGTPPFGYTVDKQGVIHKIF